MRNYYKPIRRKFQRRSVQFSSIDEVWEAYLVDMKERKKDNKSYTFILTTIGVFSKILLGCSFKRHGMRNSEKSLRKD